MEEERYITQYLDTLGSTFSLVVDMLLNPKINNQKYHELLRKTMLYLKQVDDTLSKIKIKKLSINNFFNELYLLRNLPNPEIHMLLDKYNYPQQMHDTFDEVKKDIKDYLLLDEEKQKLMDFLLIHHLVNNKDIFEYYLRFTLLNEKPCSIDALRAIFVDYTKGYLEKYVSNPEVSINLQSELNGAIGYSHKNHVWFADEEIRKLYKYGFFRPLETMFHEIMHVSQYADIAIKKLNDERTMTIIKDEILANIVQGYYKDNHHIMLSEVEANIAARKNLLSFFKRNDLHFKDPNGKYQKSIENYEQLLNNKKRKYEGNIENLDELFDARIIHHPEYLELYEQLGKYYKIDFDNLVIRRDDFTGGLNDRNK